MPFWNRKTNQLTFPACLRCPEIGLQRLPESDAVIEFFACPACFRHYAREAGGALTYRWLHPISLALYPVIFESDPVPLAAENATGFMQMQTRDVMEKIVKEIELELRSPTQAVRDIVHNQASEEECRAYLTAYVQEARRLLAERPDAGDQV